MNFLTVGGVNLSPYINSMSTADEPIWSSASGRTITTEFVGRIIGRKWKLNCGCRVLTQEESAIIHNALTKNDFLEVSFIPTNSSTDTPITKQFYVSAINDGIYSYAKGLPRYSGKSFNLIEK